MREAFEINKKCSSINCEPRQIDKSASTESYLHIYEDSFVKVKDNFSEEVPKQKL